MQHPFALRPVFVARKPLAPTNGCRDDMMESMSCMEGVRLAMQSRVDVLPFHVIHDV
jgi:hypothetical protein